MKASDLYFCKIPLQSVHRISSSLASTRASFSLLLPLSNKADYYWWRFSSQPGLAGVLTYILISNKPWASLGVTCCSTKQTVLQPNQHHLVKLVLITSNHRSGFDFVTLNATVRCTVPCLPRTSTPGDTHVVLS